MNRAKHICTYEDCSATFKKRERYETHLLKHTGERPFACTFEGCDKTYARSFHLKRHEETHKKMFKCTLPGCSQILKTKSTLQKHQDVFHVIKDNKKKYKCSECNEVFTKHSMLRRHIYVHSGVKEYKCSEPGCDKSFSMPSLLKKHMKNHLGYNCEESDCNKSFPRWSLLCKHKREFHRKNFTCNICEKVFNYACNLKAHLLTHKLEQDIFRCTVPKCIRAYRSQRSLSTHMKTFHETYTIACPEGNCYRFLQTEEDLEKHIRRRHRRRLKKKMPKKPDFAEILSGFAKGKREDLKLQPSNTVLEEKVMKSKNGVMDLHGIHLNTPDTSLVQIDKQSLGDAAKCSQQLININSEEKIKELKDETSKKVPCTDSADITKKDECSKLDMNSQISNRNFDEKVESKHRQIKAPCFDQNDKHIVSAKGLKSNFNLPFLNTSFEEKSQDGLVEIEVVCQNFLESSLNVENNYSDEGDCCSCKDDHTCISYCMPSGKVA